MAEKIELDLAIALPEVDDAADACATRLLASLNGRPGVEKAHIVAKPGTQTMLCLHYDAGVLPLPRLRELVASAGAEITARYGHILWTVTGIANERRSRTVSDLLCALPGVLEAKASSAGSVRVEFDRERTYTAAIQAALVGMGVQRYVKDQKANAVPPSGVASLPAESADEHQHEPSEAHDDETGDHSGHAHAHGGLLGPNTELIFALTCGVLLGVGFAIETFATGLPAWAPLACYLGAYLFGGFYTVREAFDNLRLKRFEIDTLMLVAAAGAAALGAWAEGALLLFLFSLGHALEHYAMGRAKRAIEALAELAPRTATVRRDGATLDLPVEQLRVGDVVIVRPDARLPADGFVVLGESSVNQAPVTGESIPVDKRAVDDPATARSDPDRVQAAHRVFAGTINGNGAIEVEVTRLSSDSALAKVVKLVSEAETQKSPTQLFTDRFERIFVPAVLALAFVLLFAWVVVDEPFRDSFYRSMAVLVAASPCALAIATPSAVLSGVARAARAGVLVKGGGPLEELGSLTAIAFDKTGTLTKGEPRITDIVPADGIEADDLLAVAVAVESLSDHPLARAIVSDGKTRLGDRALPVATNIESLIGRGITATLDGEKIAIGKAEMFGDGGFAPLAEPIRKSVEDLRDGGRTTMIVRRGAVDLGVIGLMDTPREAARATLQALRDLGITRMIMISGDNQRVAEAIARDVGLDEAWGDLMPEDKVTAIEKLRREGKVAMVGDGVNDAPAMANATVGIAMGAAGSDVALETADVALMADDLSHLPFAVALSRTTRSIIRQNVFVSLGIVAILVPATIFGLGIGPAVAVHEGSTLLVVFNALRLLAFKDRAGSEGATP